MTAAENAFRELLRRGLDGREPDGVLFRGLTAADWEAVYGMAKRQTVCGICYDSLCRLPDALLPPGALLPRWVARVNAIENSNVRMRRAVTELVSLFRDAGLHPVVQKGLSVARFYPDPDARESGDIDLWLTGDEMRKAVDVLDRMGCGRTPHPDASVSCDYRGFVVEFHPRLINVSRPKASRRLDAYARELCKGAGYGRGDIPSPPPVLELLLLDIHIMRHAFGNGIGLRQICDYVLAARALRGSYDPEEFVRLCRMLGITRWTALLNAYAVECLGADPGDLPPSGWTGQGRLPVGRLHGIISSGGNFGHHLRKHRFEAGSTRKTKLHTLKMLAKRSVFAARIAPAEAFWNVVRLVAGQVH